jgi:peptidoglycan/LPS O-acetylase OafA/YrhL
VGLGQAGVDIFFVISGFIIFYTTAVTSMDWREFTARRIIRIAPTYWLYTAVAIVAFFVAPSAFRHFVLVPWHTIASFLFIPDYHPIVAGLIQPILGVGWTLNYEMFFYAVFALLLTLRVTARLRAILAIMTSLVALGLLFRPEAAALKTYSDPLMLEFAGGCVLGWMVIRGVRVPRFLCLALAALGVLGFASSLAIDEWPRCIRWGVPSILLVAAAVFFEARYGIRRVLLLKRLGDASYSLYLTHIFTIPAAVMLWSHAGLSGYPWLCFVIPATVAAHAVGWLAYVMIERRISSFLAGKLFAVRSPRAAS